MADWALPSAWASTCTPVSDGSEVSDARTSPQHSACFASGSAKGIELLTQQEFCQTTAPLVNSSCIAGGQEGGAGGGGGLGHQKGPPPSHHDVVALTPTLSFMPAPHLGAPGKRQEQLLLVIELAAKHDQEAGRHAHCQACRGSSCCCCGAAPPSLHTDWWVPWQQKCRWSASITFGGRIRAPHPLEHAERSDRAGAWSSAQHSMDTVQEPAALGPI